MVLTVDLIGDSAADGVDCNRPLFVARGLHDTLEVTKHRGSIPRARGWSFCGHSTKNRDILLVFIPLELEALLASSGVYRQQLLHGCNAFDYVVRDSEGKEESDRVTK